MVILSDLSKRRMLDENCATKLNGFITQLGDPSAPKRTYALLGQSYFTQVMCCQMDDVVTVLSKDFDGNDNHGTISSEARILGKRIYRFSGFGG